MTAYCSSREMAPSGTVWRSILPASGRRRSMSGVTGGVTQRPRKTSASQRRRRPARTRRKRRRSRRARPRKARLLGRPSGSLKGGLERSPLSIRPCPSIPRHACPRRASRRSAPCPSALFEAEHPARHRARVAQPPAPVLNRVEELGDGAVEGVRLLEVNGMPGLGNDDEAGARNRALHQKPRLEARLVLVSRHNERGDGELLHALDELPERRPAHLHAAHRVDRALDRMLGELCREFPPAARVLVLVLHARGAERIFCGERPAALLVEKLGGRLALAAEHLAPPGLGAVAAA